MSSLTDKKIQVHTTFYIDARLNTRFIGYSYQNSQMTKGTDVHDGITEDPQMNQPIEADSAI